MMTKRSSKALANLKILLVLPVVATVLVVFFSCGENIENEIMQTEIAQPSPPSPPPPEVIEEAVEEPFIIVEEMPQFPGGEAALLTYISDHIIYPEIAKENNIQGRVTVSFCVTSQGGVDLVTILRGVDPELDAEAMRVVFELPLFKPGRQGGKPVPVWYRVPITFKLE